jgi:hypothetical protein
LKVKGTYAILFGWIVEGAVHNDDRDIVVRAHAMLNKLPNFDSKEKLARYMLDGDTA